MAITRDQPKGFWPEPKGLNFRRAISAESRKKPKERISAKRASFGQKRDISVKFLAKIDTVAATLVQNRVFRPKVALSVLLVFRLKLPKPSLQDFLVLLSAEAEIMPLSVDL